MDELIYPWQQQAWLQLQQLRERLPHAILFHGAQGIGKLAFVEKFAQSLLCEAPVSNGHACGTCAACGWFLQYGHPDYRRVRPEVLDEGDADESTTTEEEPATKKSGASARSPSKDIRIEQVRSLATFMNVSTHRSGLRVIMLYPAEALNSASANALLKTLEEPPPSTIFLLISHRPERLLPTILSRCRKFAMGMPSATDALDWLKTQGVKDTERWLAEQGGAPLAALEAAQSGSAEGHDDLLTQFARPDMATALSVAERLQKIPLSSLVAWQQRWLYDLLLVKLCAKVRYYPRHQKVLTALAANVPAERLQQALRNAGERRAVADHPLSARLFIEDMLLEYTQIFSHTE
jgi:DNA polymerase-3 subunit delta'